jgi:hypothetical protein
MLQNPHFPTKIGNEKKPLTYETHPLPWCGIAPFLSLSQAAGGIHSE